MGSTASFAVPGSYAPVVYKYPPNRYPFQVESAHSGTRHLRLDRMWGTTFVVCSHWTVPRLQNAVVFIIYGIDQILLKVKHIGKEAHLSFLLALFVNDSGNNKAKCIET